MKPIQVEGFGTLELNDSNELSKEQGKITKAFVDKLPRVQGKGSMRRPYVKIGDRDIALGYHFLNAEELAVFKKYDSEHRGSGGVSSPKAQELKEQIEWLLKQDFGKMNAEIKKRFEPLMPKDKKLENIATKVNGLSEEERKALAKMLGF